VIFFYFECAEHGIDEHEPNSTYRMVLYFVVKLVFVFEKRCCCSDCQLKLFDICMNSAVEIVEIVPLYIRILNLNSASLLYMVLQVLIKNTPNGLTVLQIHTT
jgi:hypothetical protein